MAVAGKRQHPGILSCDPCHYTEETVEAVGFCSECIEYLCSDCIKYHKKIKATREHYVYTGDLPTETSPFVRIKSMMKCPNHCDQIIAYLCNDHSEHFCIKCARESHMTCSITEITALVDQKMSAEVIGRYLFKTSVSDIDVIQKEIKKNLLTLTKEKKQALEKRNQLIDLLQKTIENLEQSCSMIEKVFTETTGTLREKHREYEDKKDEKKEIKSFLETMLNFGTKFHLYLAASSVQNVNIGNSCTESLNQIYHIEDSIGSTILNLIQTVSTMSFDVALKQNKPVEQEINTFKSNENVRETDKLTRIKVKQLPPPDTSSETCSDEVSLAPHAKYKTTTLMMKKAGMTLHKICLEGAGFKGENLDVAATDSGVVVIALRKSGSVLFLDNTFTLIKLVTLPCRVLGVCCIDKLRIAVAWSDQRIRKYVIKNNNVRMYNDLILSRNCSCITSNGKKIICLYADCNSDENRSQVCIEIRDHFTGNICTKTSLEMTTNDKSVWEIFSPPSKNEILISNGETVKVISETGSELREMHHAGISSITGDNTGNVCIFQKRSNLVLLLPSGGQKVNSYRVENFVGAAMTYCGKLDSWVLLGFKRP